MDQREIIEPTMREALEQNLVTVSVGNHHTEAVSAEQEAVDRTWLPQVTQDLHNEERVYIEVPNLSNNNSVEINIISKYSLSWDIEEDNKDNLPRDRKRPLL
jgi:hypothetical protein